MPSNCEVPDPAGPVSDGSMAVQEELGLAKRQTQSTFIVPAVTAKAAGAIRGNNCVCCGRACEDSDTRSPLTRGREGVQLGKGDVTCAESTEPGKRDVTDAADTEPGKGVTDVIGAVVADSGKSYVADDAGAEPGMGDVTGAAGADSGKEGVSDDTGVEPGKSDMADDACTDSGMGDVTGAACTDPGMKDVSAGAELGMGT
jgi:hypothetical protein